MLAGLSDAKNVGGMRDSPKKDVELDDALVEGPFEGFVVWFGERKEASGV